MKRYVGLLGVVVVTAGLAVVGALGGAYLADRGASRQADSTAVTGRPATGSGDAGPGPSGSAARSEPPARSGAPTPSKSSGEQPVPRTYRLDRVIYDRASMSVTLVSAETTGGKLRLNIRYRNDSPVGWPVSCPTADVDLVSSQVTLPDGRAVRPERTWCAATRAGESFSIRPGEQVDSWAVYPAIPPAGSSFALTWYDFPDIEVRLR
ncbi:hypothetical protein GA0070606_4485 [Micromonospora citrea]|uniref:Uncharacterized protein n=1 Tax=Micromonospora citrea TaxID=47855 RepID=A0A1C6VLD3_9ACTN|nr:hypothetical protein [Micromonospora citrea]SCL67133.1 hypothetical protein GA0070606_4485 [Micromonospora citrea]